MRASTSASRRSGRRGHQRCQYAITRVARVATVLEAAGKARVEPVRAVDLVGTDRAAAHPSDAPAASSRRKTGRTAPADARRVPLVQPCLVEPSARPGDPREFLPRSPGGSHSCRAMGGRPHPMDSETLLREQAWLHALRRSLGGAAAAEDVVQETWLAALARPPAGKERPQIRAFLTTVARRVAGAWRHGEARRRERERAAGRAEHVAP